MYEDMKKRVEHVVHSSKVDTRHDHPTIVKVFYHSDFISVRVIRYVYTNK